MKDLTVFLCHPDDEVLSFGPLLFGSSIRAEVYQCVDCGPQRWGYFQASVTSMGNHTPKLLTGAPLDGESNLSVAEFQPAIDRVVSRLADAKTIITHDPYVGDVGHHFHHRYLARAVILAAKKYNKLSSTYVLHHQGDEILPIFCNDYEGLMRHYHQHYSPFLEYLKPEHYPLRPYCMLQRAVITSEDFTLAEYAPTAVMLDGENIADDLWELYLNKDVRLQGGQILTIQGLIDEEALNWLKSCGWGDPVKLESTANDILDVHSGRFRYNPSKHQLTRIK